MAVRKPVRRIGRFGNKSRKLAKRAPLARIPRKVVRVVKKLRIKPKTSKIATRTVGTRPVRRQRPTSGKKSFFSKHKKLIMIGGGLAGALGLGLTLVKSKQPVAPAVNIDGPLT